MRVDPRTDFVAVVDGLEAVTVLRAGSSMATSVAHALRRRDKQHESEPSGGHASADDVNWHLPVAELPERPRLGDEIVDAHGERFTVLQVRGQTFASRWLCVARNLALACGLDQYVDIETAVFVKGDGGAESPVWQVAKTGVRARVQPIEAVVQTREGRQVTSL